MKTFIFDGLEYTGSNNVDYFSIWHGVPKTVGEVIAVDVYDVREPPYKFLRTDNHIVTENDMVIYNGRLQ